MKMVLAALCTVISIGAAGQCQAEAYVHAADLYPYCSINSRNGARNCYISRRAQCEFHDPCVNNPSYIGDDRARSFMRNNKPDWRWWR